MATSSSQRLSNPLYYNFHPIKKNWQFIQIVESQNNLFPNNENEYQLNLFKYLNNND